VFFFLPSFGCVISVPNFKNLGGLDLKNLVLLSNSIIIQLPRIEEKMVVFDWFDYDDCTNYLH
jgi:hypothetical protein